MGADARNGNANQRTRQELRHYRRGGHDHSFLMRENPLF
jgi:hypothetical protein